MFPLQVYTGLSGWKTFNHHSNSYWAASKQAGGAVQGCPRGEVAATFKGQAGLDGRGSPQLGWLTWTSLLGRRLLERSWDPHPRIHPCSLQLYELCPNCMWPRGLWEGLEDTGGVGLGEQTFSTAMGVILCVGCRHFSVSALKAPNLHPPLCSVSKPIVSQSEL